MFNLVLEWGCSSIYITWWWRKRKKINKKEPLWWSIVLGICSKMQRNIFGVNHWVKNRKIWCLCKSFSKSKHFTRHKDRSTLNLLLFQCILHHFFILIFSLSAYLLPSLTSCEQEKNYKYNSNDWEIYIRILAVDTILVPMLFAFSC